MELNQVLYLKYVYDHEVEFTLKDGSRFSETGSMKQFEAELAPKGFIRIYSNCRKMRPVSIIQKAVSNGAPGCRPGKRAAVRARTAAPAPARIPYGALPVPGYGRPSYLPADLLPSAGTAAQSLGGRTSAPSRPRPRSRHLLLAGPDGVVQQIQQKRRHIHMGDALGTAHNLVGELNMGLPAGFFPANRKASPRHRTGQRETDCGQIPGDLRDPPGGRQGGPDSDSGRNVRPFLSERSHLPFLTKHMLLHSIMPSSFSFGVPLGRIRNPVSMFSPL